MSALAEILKNKMERSDRPADTSHQIKKAAARSWYNKEIMKILTYIILLLSVRVWVWVGEEVKSSLLLLVPLKFYKSGGCVLTPASRPIGLTIGSDFSSASWEPVRRTIEQLARSLFSDDSLREKHRKYLDQLQWDPALSLFSTKRKHFVPAKRDAKNPGVLDAEGNLTPTPHFMFVDDDCYAEIFLLLRVEEAVASSIEAIFIVLGNSDTFLNVKTLSPGTNSSK